MLSILAAAVLFQASAAAAPAPRPSVITQPDWSRRPNAEDMTRFYPKAAADAHIEGRATLRCTVTAAGDLADCTATGEEPTGQGFDQAVLNLAPLFKMKPMAKDGVPVSGGKVAIPIRFMLPKPAVSPEMAMRCYGYAAAVAERNPSAPNAGLTALAWRLFIEFRAVPENWKPSELEGLIVSLRKTGAEHLDGDQYKNERDECATLANTSGVLSNLSRLASAPR
jgi:TonB family protein